MGVGWIDNIYNNSRSTWYLRSVDARHNGALSGGGQDFALDDGEFHPLAPGTHYKADWCAIPWYHKGDHFKAVSRDRREGVLFYTSEVDGGNWIVYEELHTGRQVARQAVPKGSDFHCTMRFEPGGVFMDVVNNNAFSGENALYQVLSEAKEWVQVLAPVLGEAIKGRSAKPKSP